MRLIHSISIRGRLILGFSFIVLILILAVGMILAKVHNAKNSSEQLILVGLPLYNAVSDLYVYIYADETALSTWVNTNDPKYKNEVSLALNNMDKLELAIDMKMQDIADNKILQDWQTVKSMIAQLKSLQNTLLADADSVHLKQTMRETFIPQLDKIFNILDGKINAEGHREGGLLTRLHAKLQTSSNEVMQEIAVIETTGYFLLIAGILVSIFVVIVTTRSIICSVKKIRLYSNKIASGDLTNRLIIESEDEMGELAKDLNTMTDSLVNITKVIIDASHNMVTTLAQVRQSVSAQSSGATEQASSINEITASLEEIEKSSEQTMEKAQALGKTAERTHEKGQQGLEAVEESITGMKTVREKVQLIAQTILELSNQTQQVGEITAVVNNLAQQSKMLALNASIEAAKAGEAGKGFAVVATEVKNLAEQSEQSTTQVQKILEDIRHATEKAVMVTEEGTKGVDYGTNLVEQTGEIVRSLSEVIYETTIATQQIEAAVRQESVGIEQITIGMNEINQVTSTFVESARQTTQAIENLAVIAKKIKEQIDIYKI